MIPSPPEGALIIRIEGRDHRAGQQAGQRPVPELGYGPEFPKLRPSAK